MVRRIAIIGFAALLASSIAAGRVDAQGRGRGNGGGPRGNGPAGPPPFARRAPGAVAAPPVVVIRPHGIGPAPRVFGPRPLPGFYSNFWAGPYYNIPSYSVPLYPTLAYTTPVYPATVYSEPAYAVPSVSRHEIELEYELQRLSREVQELRRQAFTPVQPQTPQAPQAAPAAEPERPVVPTVLVFRDGRRLSVQNYAIVGQTLWVLDERTSSRIAISELDLDATQAENRGQGVRFPLPAR
jgi:hypothetical protein